MPKPWPLKPVAMKNPGIPSTVEMTGRRVRRHVDHAAPALRDPHGVEHRKRLRNRHAAPGSRIGLCGGGSSMRTASNGEARSSRQRRGCASSMKNRRAQPQLELLAAQPPRRQEIAHEAQRVGHDIGDVAAPACHRIAAVQVVAHAEAEAAGRHLRARLPAVRSASPRTASSIAAGAAAAGGRTAATRRRPPARPGRRRWRRVR